MCMLHLPPPKRGTRDEATLKLGFPKAQSHLHLITTHFRGGGGEARGGGEAQEGGEAQGGRSSGRGKLSTLVGTGKHPLHSPPLR